jgi:hypothetical protein
MNSTLGGGLLFRTRWRFRKLGLLIAPKPELWWMRSHAMVPTLDRLDEDHLRVYFSGRDERNRSYIGYAVLDLNYATNEPGRAIVDFSAEPVLSLGELGAFDDNGVSPSCVVNDGTARRLYYIGWNRGATVRMHLFGGLALSSDGGFSFRRWSRAPILERTDREPFLNTAPYVVQTERGWRVYFVACIGWKTPDLPRYHIRSAESDDGLTFRREGHVCIDLSGPEENALARPMVLREGPVWRMWFASKGDAYRLGYAESLDGLSWVRDDSYAGLSVSADGFDSEMVEYAAVTKHRDHYIMFYNGNDYGRGGIGLAIED